MEAAGLCYKEVSNDDPIVIDPWEVLAEPRRHANAPLIIDGVLESSEEHTPTEWPTVPSRPTLSHNVPHYIRVDQSCQQKSFADSRIRQKEWVKEVCKPDFVTWLR